MAAGEWVIITSGRRLNLENPSTYRLPPQDVVDIIDAKPTPVVTVSPERSSLLLVDYEAYPPIELLARPFLKLGGIRVDPALSATQRTIQYTGLTLVRIADGEKIPVRGLPATGNAVVEVILPALPLAIITLPVLTPLVSPDETGSPRFTWFRTFWNETTT